MKSGLPSIRTRLTRALLGWSVLWTLSVSLAVWLAVQREVDELLDDTLLAAAQVLDASLPTTVETISVASTT